MPNCERDHKSKKELNSLAGTAAITKLAREVMLEAALAAIKLYRIFVSPFLGSCCRFYPSCSAYAEDALRGKGLWLGALFTIKRLLKCQPFHPGGVDAIETGT